MTRINVSDIPVELMCEATKVADVHQIMILDRRKNKIGRGEPDVAVVSPLGRKEMMSRDEVVKTFVTMRGKKLKLSSLRYETKYTVMKLEKVGVYAFRVPRSKSIEVITPDGNIARGGGFLVSVVDENNDVDMGNANWIDSKFFRKMFRIEKIPEMSRIIKDLGREVTAKKNVRDNIKIKSDEHEGKNDKSIDVEKVNDKNVGGEASKNLDNNKVTIVARIVKFGNNETIGFVVRFYGKEERMTIAKVKKLCSMKAVENMKLVERDGRNFLAGVGMKIEDLPVVQI